jgi:ERCC4-type nuclease
MISRKSFISVLAFLNKAVQEIEKVINSIARRARHIRAPMHTERRKVISWRFEDICGG